MSKIYLLRKNLPKIFALLVTLLTISASTVGAVKLTRSFVSGDDGELPKVLAAGDSQIESEDEVDEQTEGTNIFNKASNAGGNVATPKPTPTGSPEPTKKPLDNLTGSNLLPVSNTPVVNTASQNSNACIITLFGLQYDVTSLRTSHPGGDIFACGADNSSAYQGAHGNNVSRMQPYLVNSGGTSGGNTTGNTNGNTGTSGNYEDEDEEEDYERQQHELEDEFERAKQELEDEHEDEDE